MAKSKFKLLVLGSGRGGTSLVASFLDSHPKLSVAIEAQAPEFLMGRQLSEAEDFLQARVDGFVKNCQAEARQSNMVWGNKITTEQLDFLKDIASPEAVEEQVLKKIVGKKKLVFVLRDGRSCVYSKMLRTDVDLETAVLRWQQSVRWYKFFKEKKADMYVVRFEELLLRPEEQLRTVCDFLKINYHEKMLEGTDNIRLPEDYRQNGIDAAKAKVPVQALEYTDLMREELEYLGYV